MHTEYEQGFKEPNSASILCRVAGRKGNHKHKYICMYITCNDWRHLSCLRCNCFAIDWFCEDQLSDHRGRGWCSRLLSNLKQKRKIQKMTLVYSKIYSGQYLFYFILSKELSPQNEQILGGSATEHGTEW